MIQATYYRKYARLTVQGHAHSAEPGQDLVCAACSALVYTLAANVGNLENLGKVRDVTVKLEPGDAEVCCTPKHKFAATVELIFQAICVGFEILAADNSQYIQFEIHD